MLDLVRWSPSREIRRLENEMNRMFRDFFRPSWPSRSVIDFDGDEPVLYEPSVNVSEDADHVYVEAMVPGLKQDNLDVQLAGDRLTIRGEVKNEYEKKDRNYHVKELRAGSFQRVVGLPAEVVADKASAELKDGVLRVTLPKSQTAKEKVRHIQVKAA
jgi:HSP20 family protein